MQIFKIFIQHDFPWRYTSILFGLLLQNKHDILLVYIGDDAHVIVNQTPNADCVRI